MQPTEHQRNARGGSERAAVRVVCTDRDGRILLMRWKLGKAPPYWEPPGGGIEGDEDPLAAARREFTEETGLPATAVSDTHVPVERDFAWFGPPVQRVEHFYLARIPASAPEIRPPGLSPQEQNWLLASGWFLPAEIADGTDHLEPPNLLQVIQPWLYVPEAR